MIEVNGKLTSHPHIDIHGFTMSDVTMTRHYVCIIHLMETQTNPFSIDNNIYLPYIPETCFCLKENRLLITLT